MNLSRNFTLAEMTRSDEAERRGISNTPFDSHMPALTATALGLEQVRAMLGGRPVRVHSGYRSPALNAAVGGVANSDHALGWAADITVDGYSAYQVASATAESFLAFDQVIFEKSRGVVHVSFHPRLRREALTQAQGAGSPFQRGIVP